jgi:hypothetical protein
MADVKYIRIKNPAKSVPRAYLEKMGISTKRNNNATIGQFGSGSKLAPIAAIRKGWEWIVTASDKDGPYKMEYIAKEEDDGFEHVYYRYDDTTLKPSSFTIDAGVLSWDTNFQIFREALANALDEKIEKNLQYSIDIVDEVAHFDDHICVYLTANEETLEFIQNFDSYFSINRVPLYTDSENNSIFDPKNHFVNEKSRVFTKGVLAWTGDYEALYDYNFPDLPLNEERRVTDVFAIGKRIAHMWCKIKDIDILKEVLRAYKKNEELFEFTHVQSYYIPATVHPAWKKAWKDVWGERTVIASDSVGESAWHTAKELGYTVQRIESAMLFEILQAAGIKTINNVIGEAGEYNVIEGAPWQQEMLNKAIEVVEMEMPRITSIEIMIYRPDKHQKALALYLTEDEVIGISEPLFDEGLNKVVAALVHELDHHISGYSDCTNEFRHVADIHIARLLLDKYESGNNGR